MSPSEAAMVKRRIAQIDELIEMQNRKISILRFQLDLHKWWKRLEFRARVKAANMLLASIAWLMKVFPKDMGEDQIPAASPLNPLIPGGNP